MDRITAFWFLGPPPPYASFHELAGSVLIGQFGIEEGQMILVVYAFTTEEKARLFNDEKRAPITYVPLRVEVGIELAGLLLELQKHGRHHLGFDPEKGSMAVRTISDILASIRPPD